MFNFYVIVQYYLYFHYYFPLLFDLSFSYCHFPFHFIL